MSRLGRAAAAAAADRDSPPGDITTPAAGIGAPAVGPLITVALVVPTAVLLVFHAVHFWTSATGSSAIGNFVGRALAVTCVFGICIGPVIWAGIVIRRLIDWGWRVVFGVTVSSAEMDCASAGASDAQGDELVTQVGQHLLGRNVMTTSPCL